MIKNRLIFGIIFVLLASLTSCVNQPITMRENLQEFPLKIGMLADTQKTTSMETFQNSEIRSFRNPIADKFANVSLRPPALEALSGYLLENLLEKLAIEQVDIILYLGDAANSGCKDELEEVFGQLRRVREQYMIPTYFVIGNHDYLGTGNQTLREQRQLLCDRVANDFSNLYVSKLELMYMTQVHNRASARMDAIFDLVDKLSPPAKPEGHAKCEDSHNFAYYAGVLRPKDRASNSVDILLADTSDYNNVWFRPVFKGVGCEFLAGWGTKGSMSSDQIIKLQRMSCLPQPNCDLDEVWNQVGNPMFGIDYRIVASHYDPRSFNAIYPWHWSPSFVRDNLGFLLSDGVNMWLGAHHHDKKPTLHNYPVGTTFRSGPSGAFVGLSVGSTTDYYPHAAIVEASTSENSQITTGVGYRTIMLDDEAELCDGIMDVLTDNASVFSPLQCQESHTTIDDQIGVTRIYAERGCWNENVYTTLSSNLERALSLFDTGSISQQRANLCLALRASKAEWKAK